MKKRFSLLGIALVATFLVSCGEQTSTQPTTTSQSTSSYVEDVDVVANTKIKLDENLFAKVMQKKTSRDYDKTLPDLNRDGVERMLTSYAYEPDKSGDVFANYVDGDTTQFSSYNGIYTVKVRYLAVDTPESTSEVEEWGKSASNFNKSKLTNATYVIVQSAGAAKTGLPAAADIDTYGRSLAYVWYTDVQKAPEEVQLSDFRNLNLELVYEGYSLFSGALDEMDQDFYNAFMQANDIAKYYKRGMYSGVEDENYYYGAAKQLKISALYDSTLVDPTTGYSLYCDNYTRWSFDGYVSRIVGTSFYIQDTFEEGKHPYGLYVFTLRSYAPVQVGNRIRVTGILDYYGGLYELKGVSYSFFNPSEYDIKYLDANGNPTTNASECDVLTSDQIKPLELTMNQIASGDYQSVLVKVKTTSQEGLYFVPGESTYNGEKSYLSYGGSQEYNTYNETRPFYNTDNSMVVFAYDGKHDDNSSLLSDNNALRIKVERDIVLKGDYTTTSYICNNGVKSEETSTEINGAITSYKFFCGGTNYYVSGSRLVDEPNIMGGDDIQVNTSYADVATNLSNGSISETQTPDGVRIFKTVFARKSLDSLTGICVRYISTSGKNNKMTLSITNPSDVGTFTETV